jgi:hypothetical protein
VALSESLYPSLQMLEIALRNAIHQSASQNFGRGDWFDDPHIIPIQSHEEHAVQKARDTLRKNKKSTDVSHVISELTFGFWTGLLSRRYEQALWPKLLRATFPAMPRSMRTRAEASKRFEQIRKLRNRIFHHEPISHWQDLALQHQHLRQALTWIRPEADAFLAKIDRFPQVYTAKSQFTAFTAP